MYRCFKGLFPSKFPPHCFASPAPKVLHPSNSSVERGLLWLSPFGAGGFCERHREVVVTKIPNTPLKINGWNIVLMEVWFRSLSFLFMGDGCRFQPLIFQGVHPDTLHFLCCFRVKISWPPHFQIMIRVIR